MAGENESPAANFDFEKELQAWRERVQNEGVSTPNDLRIAFLLQLRDAWKERGQRDQHDNSGRDSILGISDPQTRNMVLGGMRRQLLDSGDLARNIVREIDQLDSATRDIRHNPSGYFTN